MVVTHKSGVTAIFFYTRKASRDARRRVTGLFTRKCGAFTMEVEMPTAGRARRDVVSFPDP